MKKYYLLEALANTIGKGLLGVFPFAKGHCAYSKASPPVKGVIDYVEVEISLQR